jgi:uncharacterized protein
MFALPVLSLLERWLTRLALALLRVYQGFSACCLPSRCRFYPTCSHYACSAIKSVGLLRGVWLTIKRLARCHPWHSGGVDWPPSSNGTAQTSF